MDKKDIDAVIELLSEDVQEYMREVFQKCKNKEEFVKSLLVGPCPKCGSENTLDCEDSPLNAIDIGVCADCLILWCLECKEIFDKGQTTCPHWKLCDKCTGDDEEVCNIDILDCRIIKEWKLKRNHGLEFIEPDSDSLH